LIEPSGPVQPVGLWLSGAKGTDADQIERSIRGLRVGAQIFQNFPSRTKKYYKKWFIADSQEGERKFLKTLFIQTD
jgi:hypothetical protein